MDSISELKRWWPQCWCIQCRTKAQVRDEAMARTRGPKLKGNK